MIFGQEVEVLKHKEVKKIQLFQVQMVLNDKVVRLHKMLGMEEVVEEAIGVEGQVFQQEEVLVL